jgi:hypothetical protein
VRRVIGSVACSLALALGASSEAGAIPRNAVEQLRNEPCPAPYLVAEPDSGASDEAIDQAHRWRFKIASKYVRLKPPVSWKRDPINSQTFRAGIVSLNWMRVLFFDYRENGNKDSLRKARDLALDFVNHQPLGGRNTSSQAWDAKTVGDRGSIIAYVTRAASCEHLISARRARTLLTAISKHAGWILRHRVSNNHGLFDALGLAAMSRQVHFLPGAGKWRDVARSRFERLLRSRMKPQDDFWLEQSSGYHWGATNLLDRMLEILRIGPDDLENLLARMERNSAWLVEPDRKIVQFGDSRLLRAPDSYRELSETLSGLHALYASGFAFAREGDSYLAQTATFHNTTHKQSDDLSFDLFDRGHRIVSDTGIYDKDPGQWSTFTRSSRAHSTVTSNGRSFGRSGKLAYGSGINASGSGPSALGGTWYAIKSRNPLLRRQGIQHSRWLVYKPQVALIVVDRLRSGHKRTYKSYFHLGPDVSVTRQADALGLSADGFSGALYSTGNGGSSLRVERGARRPLQGWTSPAFRQKEARPTAIFRTKGSRADRATTFSLAGPGLKASVLGSVGGNSVSLQLSTPAGAPVERLDLEVNHRSIAVESGP